MVIFLRVRILVSEGACHGNSKRGRGQVQNIFAQMRLLRIKAHHRPRRDALFEDRQLVEMSGILSVQRRRFFELRRINGLIHADDEIDLLGAAFLIPEVKERRILSCPRVTLDDLGEAPGLEKMPRHRAVRQRLRGCPTGQIRHQPRVQHINLRSRDDQ